MNRITLANLETSELCAMLGVSVAKHRAGAREIIAHGGAHMATLRPSQVRGFLIDAAFEFENAGAFE